MKSIADRVGITTAKRWVAWIRARKALEDQVQFLNRELTAQRVRIDGLTERLVEKDALLKDYRQAIADAKLPDEVRALLESAAGLFEGITKASPGQISYVSASLFNSWLAEYRGYKYERFRAQRYAKWDR